MPPKTVTGQLGEYTRSLADGKIAAYTAQVIAPSGDHLKISIQLSRFAEEPLTSIRADEETARKILDHLEYLKSEFAHHYLPHMRQYCELAKESFPESQASFDQFQDHARLVAALSDPELRIYDKTKRRRIRELRFRIGGTADIERLREGVWADDDDDFPDLDFGIYVNDSGEIIEWEQ